MRLKQYITELFDRKPENFEIATQTNTDFKATFNVDGKSYFMNAYMASDAGPGYHDESQDYWFVDFTRKGANFKLTNDMNSKAISVFSGIKHSFEYYLKKYKPKEFVWTSDKSHLKLYKMFAKQIAKGTPYKVNVEDGAENRDEPGKWFFSFWR